MAGIEFAEVARRLSCDEFARRYLPMSGKRARCPFHGGEHYNLAFKPDGHCHCFVCNATRDVVQLAAATWNVSQLDAARQLNHEWHLGVADDTPTAEQRQRLQEQREREAAERAAEQQRARDEWDAACVEERAAQANMYKYSMDDAETPAFGEALRRLCKAQTTADIIQAGW